MSDLNQGFSPEALSEIASLASDIYRDRQQGGGPSFCLFLGAGCSLPDAPPTEKLEDALLADMYRNLCDRKEREQKFETDFSSELLNVFGTRLETICAAYERKRGTESLERFFEKSFGSIINIPEGYFALARLLKEGYFRIVFTTNFDMLLETACSKENAEIDIIIKPKKTDAIRVPRVKTRVYKLHGTYKEPNVSSHDVKELDDQKKIHLVHFLENYSFIFVGYSARDFDIYPVLENINQERRSKFKIHWFTRTGKGESINRLLFRYTSSQNHIAVGNVDSGSKIFCILEDELKRVKKTEEEILKDQRERWEETSRKMGEIDKQRETNKMHVLDQLKIHCQQCWDGSAQELFEPLKMDEAIVELFLRQLESENKVRKTREIKKMIEDKDIRINLYRPINSNIASGGRNQKKTKTSD